MEHHVCKCCGMLLKREGNYYVCDYCMNRWMIDVANDVSAVERVAAWTALRQGDFDKATELFEEIIIKDDKNHEAYWGRALARNAIVYVNDVVEDKKVPTCNNITEASFLNDKDVKKAIELAPEDVAVGYKKQIDYLENIRVEWLEKASKEPPYDVFISFKDSDRENGIERTKDSFDAQEIYTALVDAGYKVFFSRVSLRGKVAEQYEPYIYNAIKTAKVMIVFGEKPEYFNATWIKNEWTRFKARIDGGEKHKNSLVVVVKDMNPGDLPIALRARQAMNMTDLTFFETLKNHIASIVGGTSAQKTAAKPVKKEKVKKPKVKKEKKPLTKKQKGLIGIAGAMVGVIMILCSITLIMHIANPFRFYSYDGGYYLEYYKGNESVVEIPSTYLGKPVKGIGNCSFLDNTSITSIVIPDTVTVIEPSAFEGCSSLISIEIPETVTHIGDYVFAGCDSLESITIPFVGSGNINGEMYSTSFSSLFFGNIPSSLKTVTITGGTIGDDAFKNCDSLTSVIIGDSVTSIGDYAFEGCSSLTSIVIPDTVTSIGESAFEECTSLTSVVIPNSVTAIGGNAFAGCSSLTSIAIPETVTTISSYAYAGCSSLTSIEIPDSVTSIGRDAFYNCDSLTSVIIPNSVTSIGESAFEQCDSLESITIPFVGGGGDSGSGSFSKNFAHIFGCNYDGDARNIPASLQKVIITGGTSISNYAFSNCASITTIVIPDTVTYIGYHAFADCSNLTSIKYCGTEEQWLAINKDYDWDKEMGSDYTITYNYTGE